MRVIRRFVRSAREADDEGNLRQRGAESGRRRQRENWIRLVYEQDVDAAVANRLCEAVQIVASRKPIQRITCGVGQ